MKSLTNHLELKPKLVVKPQVKKVEANNFTHLFFLQEKKESLTEVIAEDFKRELQQNCSFAIRTRVAT